MTHLPRIAVFVVFGAACTTVRTVQLPPTEHEAVFLLEELNRDVKDTSVDVRFREPLPYSQLVSLPGSASSPPMDAARVTLSSPTFAWRDLRPVERIRYVPPGGHLEGGFHGLGLGLLIGALGGAASGAIVGANPPPGQFLNLGPGATAAGYAGVFGVLGLLVGAACGAAYGHHQEVLFLPSVAPAAPE